MSINFPAIDLLIEHKNDIKDYMNNYDCNLGENATFYDIKMKFPKVNKFVFMCNEMIDCLTVPEGVTFLRPYLFYNKIGNSTYGKIKKVISHHPLTDVFEMCFYSNPHLQEISFQSLGAIRSYAFASCTALKELPMIGNLKIIESLAFDGCRAMTKISLPNTLEDVASNAFRNCTMINTVVLEENFNCSIDLSQTNLTAQSIHGIALNLKDLTGTSITKNITLGVSNIATASPSDLALIESKGWTVGS